MRIGIALIFGCLITVGVVVGLHFGAGLGLAAACALYVLMPYHPGA